MRHPTDGVLRRLLDEPAGVADADRHHVADCASCRARLDTMRADADLVAAALSTEVDIDIDASWRRLSSTTTSDAPRRLAAPRRPRRLRSIVGRPMVAGVAVAAVLTGAGTAAANDWFEIFRTERLEPVGISTDDLSALPDLDDYGDMQVEGDLDVHTAGNAEAAAAETGLDVPEVKNLPGGVSDGPTYQVAERVTATFTLSADAPAPPGLDGAQVRLVAGPGVAAIWTNRRGLPALLVGRAVAPTASSSGVPFEAVRDHLLSIPGLPDDVAASLRTFNADSSTLPIPVPEDRFTSSSAMVDGIEATVLTSHDRSVAAVAWVDDGVVTVVAGSLDADEVLAVARELG